MKICIRFLLILLLIICPIYNVGAGSLTLTPKQKAIEKAGDIVSVALPLSAFSLIWLKKDKYGATELIMSLASTVAVSEILKQSIDKSRPDGSDHDSFPSAHTAVAFSAAVFIQKRYNWKYTLAAWVGAGFVGYSRWYSKRHYAIDVAAGALIGTVCGFICTTPRVNNNITVDMFSDNSTCSIRINKEW